jgi:hypothetical protein
VRSANELDKAQRAIEVFAFGAKDEERREAGARQTAGRQFVQEGAVWRDQVHSKTQRVQAIEQYSAAYFAVLRRLPELELYWKEYDQVLVAGKRVSIQVSKGGAQQLSDAELTRLVAEFRKP